VPVFWMATEDHDFEEVATVELINRDCGVSSARIQPALHRSGVPVGQVKLDNSIKSIVDSLFDLLPKTEFTTDVRKLLGEAYAPGVNFGDAFARLLSRLTGERGLILLDPLDVDLKRLATPMYEKAAARAPELAQAIVDRSRELEAAGYHAQVTPSPDSFPLFLHDESGARYALTRTDSGAYRVKGNSPEYSTAELSEWARRAPERCSPNVTLRSVVQDFLLPTIAYYGGSAEIAYFAQTSEVYRILERPPTTILPRASLTFVEKHTGRAMERYGLTFGDLFQGPDHVLARVVEEHLGKETTEAFAHTNETVNQQLDALREELRRTDATLAEALEKGRRKINYQLDGLRTRFNRSQMARDEALQRQLAHAFDLLYPHKALQERHINVTSFVARHGHYFLDWIFDAIELGNRSHQIIYL